MRLRIFFRFSETEHGSLTSPSQLLILQGNLVKSVRNSVTSIIVVGRFLLASLNSGASPFIVLRLSLFFFVSLCSSLSGVIHSWRMSWKSSLPCFKLQSPVPNSSIRELSFGQYSISLSRRALHSSSSQTSSCKSHRQG